MGNMYVRLRTCAGEEIEAGFDILDLAKKLPLGPLRTQLEALGQEEIEIGMETDDVAVDIEFAKQVLTLGRGKAPNKPLARKIVDLDEWKAAREQQKPRDVIAFPGLPQPPDAA